MSKVELIAAAQVLVVGGDAASISFRSNNGFKTATRSSAGVYGLELDHHHDLHEFVINVTRQAADSGQISASLIDKRNIAVNAFGDGAGDASPAADTSFFITVYRID